MSGHTPGPWAHWYNDGSWHVGADSDAESLFSGRQENQLNGNCEPDARLIAAAPDLLEALEAMVFASVVHGFEADSVVPIARAAIARAKGEQP